MDRLKELFANNRAWSAEVRAQDPEFFSKLSHQQTPEYLWIGCSDSRVPANQVVGMLPGELFVHRNVANLVVSSDLNMLSVLQFAVEVLKVKHVIVCGHYGCGGVKAALTGERLGLVDLWLRHVQHVKEKHADRLDQLPASAQADRLCELNVIEQVNNIGHTTVISEAWFRRQKVTIHGWIYSLTDGLLRDLDICAADPHELAKTYSQAIERIPPVAKERSKRRKPKK